MLNYYGYAQGDYKRGDSTALKAGFSTLLDKTMDMQLLIAKKKFENQYDSLLEAKVNLQKKETNKNDNNNNNNGNNTDNNVTPAATAKLQLKAGKKTVKAGSTIALKKGKTVQLSLTINGVTGKNVKYKTSNKKVVKISSTGKMKAVKKSKKKVKVTASFGKQKITFKVKTKFSDETHKMWGGFRLYRRRATKQMVAELNYIKTEDSENEKIFKCNICGFPHNLRSGTLVI